MASISQIGSRKPKNIFKSLKKPGVLQIRDHRIEHKKDGVLDSGLLEKVENTLGEDAYAGLTDPKVDNALNLLRSRDFQGLESSGFAFANEARSQVDKTVSVDGIKQKLSINKSGVRMLATDFRDDDLVFYSQMMSTPVSPPVESLDFAFPDTGESWTFTPFL